jgi:hypothetical protein
MQLSIGIFNALLFLLVILILHFALKNLVLNKPKYESLVESAPCKVSNINLESEKEDMLKYVLDDNDAKISLDNYFKDKAVTNVPDDSCKHRNDQNYIPVSTTCDPKMDANLFTNDMKVLKDCELPQDKKNYTLLKIYEDEKPENGGDLYGGIKGYDDEDVYFSSY